MKIFFYESTDVEARVLQEKLLGHSSVFYPGKLDESSNGGDADVISVFVNSKVSADVMKKFPSLKAVVVRATGFDNVDLAECKSKDIVVMNVPAYGSETVAEFTFALLLSLARKIVLANERARYQGETNEEELCGLELHGKTLGVVGTGRIGSNVCKIAKGFSMKILAFDMFQNKELSADGSVEYASLEKLVAESDFISLHLPYTNENHHLFNAELLSKTKRGCLLINTARGALVDSTALLHSLKTGQLGGVGLDVLEYEGALKDEVGEIEKGLADTAEMKALLSEHALMGLPNVILTPHVAYYTQEAVSRILETTVQNVEEFASSGQCRNTVT